MKKEFNNYNNGCIICELLLHQLLCCWLFLSPPTPSPLDGLEFQKQNSNVNDNTEYDNVIESTLKPCLVHSNRVGQWE